MNKLKFKPSEEFKEMANGIFQKQKEIISKPIPNVDIHHIGSTSIPGAITKGDLDIQARVPKKDFLKAREYLGKHYAINQPDNWSSTFASFKDDKNFEIPVGIQLTVIGSEEDQLFQTQQFLLTNNSDVLDKYNQMKLKFDGKDIDDYRKARAKFFEDLKLINSTE